MMNLVAESIKREVMETMGGMEFKFKGNFELTKGLKISIYGLNHITLFDATELVELIKEKEENSQHDRQRVMKGVSHEHIYRVKVEYESGQKQEKVLVSEGGVYELIMLIDNEVTNRIRKSFALLLEQYRINSGYTVEKFIEACYRNKPRRICEDMDSRITLQDEYKQLFMFIPADELYLAKDIEFITVGENIIFDDSTQYLYENLDKAELNLKVYFGINAASLMKVLPSHLSEDLLVLLQEMISKNQVELFKMKATGDTEFIMGQELFDFMLNRLFVNNFEDTKNKFFEIMKDLYKSESVAKILTDSVTKFSVITNDTNLEKSDYLKTIIISYNKAENK